MLRLRDQNRDIPVRITTEVKEGGYALPLLAETNIKIKIKMMEINEIIKKTELTTEEMIFVVEEFVFEKTKERVTIDLHKKLNHIPKEFQHHFLIPQLQMLDSAYNDALVYFLNKK